MGPRFALFRVREILRWPSHPPVRYPYMCYRTRRLYQCMQGALGDRRSRLLRWYGVLSLVLVQAVSHARDLYAPGVIDLISSRHELAMRIR